MTFVKVLQFLSTLRNSNVFSQRFSKAAVYQALERLTHCSSLEFYDRKRACGWWHQFLISSSFVTLSIRCNESDLEQMEPG